MSEPLSSSEIEDVLSSIRRLVSEDMRPAPGRSGISGASKLPEQAKAAPIPVGENKLILTPALRVVQSSDRLGNVPPPMFTAVPRVDLRAETAQNEHDVEVSAMMANLGAGVDTQDDEWEAETGDAAPIAHDAVNLAQAMSENTENFEFLRQIPMDDPADGVEVDRLETEPDTGQPPKPEANFAEMVEESDDRFEASVEREVVAAAWEQTDGFDDVDDEASDDFAAELRAETIEPDAEWAAAAEASVIAALAAEEEGASSREPEVQPDDLLDDYLDKDTRIDEAMLRDLVRDVLREELAGRIGERITRNIRKLVRAEIANALAAQELS